MEQERNWHYLTAAGVAEAFKSDTGAGLSEAEAARRLRRRRNRIWQVRGETVGKYAARSLLDPSAVLLLLSVAAAAVYGEGAAAAAVLIIMLAGKTAELLAFTAADRAFRKSAEGAVPKARVVRGGNVRQVPAELVAEGDLVILDTGDTVPCDIRITAADSVLAAENLPGGNTGLYIKNAEPVDRRIKDVPIEYRANMLYAGSSVVYGFCMGIAVATGKRTLLVSRDGMISLTGTGEVPVFEKLSEWSRLCRLVLVAAAFVITVLGTAFGQGLIKVFLPCAVMASACMSEFLAAFGAVLVAKTLSGKHKKESGGEEKTLFRAASDIEKAASADVIALRSAALFKCGVMTLHSFFVNGKAVMPGADDTECAGSLVSFAAYAAGLQPDGSGGEDSSFLPAPYLKRLQREYGSKEQLYAVCAHKSAAEQEARGFDCSLLRRGNDYVFAAAGDPLRLLDLCTKERAGDKVVPLTNDRRALYKAYAERLLRQGTRVYAAASRPSVYNSLRRISVLFSELILEGFISVSEKPEKDCLEYLDSYRKMGGSLVVFTGPGDEERLFAAAEGIFRKGDIFISQKDAESAKTLPVDPGSLIMLQCPDGAQGAEYRNRFIKVLCEKHTCAYVGCGAEDSICMQSASVSFACEAPGLAGSGIPQALRCTASGITEAVGGGFGGACRMMSRFRETLCLLKSAVRYLVASQIARLFLLLICSVLSLPVPGAGQMVLLGVVLDMTAAFCTVGTKRSGGGELRVSPVPETFEDMLVPGLAGIIIAVFSIVSPFLGKLVMAKGGFECNFTDKSLSACFFAGIALALPAVYAEMTAENGLFGGRFGRLFPAAALAPVASLALIFTLSPVGEAVFMEFPGWLPLTFELLPLFAVVLFLAVVRALNKNKEK